MVLIKTQRFTISDKRDSDENAVSGSIHVEWTEQGNDKSTFFCYGSIPTRDAAIFNAMEFIVINRNLMD